MTFGGNHRVPAFNKDTAQVFQSHDLSFDMFWQAGDKTYLIHTGQWAHFSRYLDGDMVMVVLAGESEEIPVHLDDIDYQAPDPAPSSLTDDSTAAPVIIEKVLSGGRFTGSGSGLHIGISVDPEDWPIRQFHVLLVNDTEHDMSCQLILQAEGSPAENCQGEAAPHTWTEIGAFPMNRLHHQPTLRVSSWQKLGLRQISRPDAIIRPRPKSLFNRMRATGFLPGPIALFDLPDQERRNAQPALSVHTRSTPHFPEDRRRISAVPTPEERASFQIELDLHAEVFLPNAAKLTDAEIFRRQMQRFEGYLQQAIRMGIPHVFIIHGLGKGKLKAAIAERCRSYPEVRTIRNDHHPRYGFGASEILFH